MRNVGIGMVGFPMFNNGGSLLVLHRVEYEFVVRVSTLPFGTYWGNH